MERIMTDDKKRSIQGFTVQNQVFMAMDGNVSMVPIGLLVDEGGKSKMIVGRTGFHFDEEGKYTGFGFNVCGLNLSEEQKKEIDAKIASMDGAAPEDSESEEQTKSEPHSNRARLREIVGRLKYARPLPPFHPGQVVCKKGCASSAVTIEEVGVV